MKRLVVASGVLVAVVSAVVVYFLVNAESLHQQGAESFQDFGYKVVPLAQGPVAEEQRVPMNPDAVPQPSRSTQAQIITGLQAEKQVLIGQVAKLQGEVDAYKKQVGELRSKLDVYSAPVLPQGVTQSALLGLLNQVPELQVFTGYQKELMGVMAYREYMRIVAEYGVLLTPRKRDQLIRTGLSRYAFCVADAVDVIANDASERNKLRNYIEKGQEDMATPLQSDLVKGLLPCKRSLDEYVARDLMPAG
ncbi:hypothetical protein WH50_15055 [Pokkaliibacter plantistimulans]|uniref:Uncharacterized protein n=1 Tax=Pokkaliibacter plantistimulans TaxID=1635171 RepID=A0ABX5LUY4_9GAMM|nr:hypothetical protein [Pokkaliibacter plantistimulans]PXF30462.1 hypothetical protein WH50_15055 [Pokkaliibacter plantistimulans]